MRLSRCDALLRPSVASSIMCSTHSETTVLARLCRCSHANAFCSDLWLSPKDAFPESLSKWDFLKHMCADIGVHTDTALIADVLIVPLLAWYHPRFGDECSSADIALQAEHPKVEDVMTDFAMCKWPAGLSSTDDSLAKQFDDNNHQNLETADQLRSRAKIVISFSHFLPRQDLCPEKRFLFFPPLPGAIGSFYLGVRRLLLLLPTRI